jgi:hypothetical protein
VLAWGDLGVFGHKNGMPTIAETLIFVEGDRSKPTGSRKLTENFEALRLQPIIERRHPGCICRRDESGSSRWTAVAKTSLIKFVFRKSFRRREETASRRSLISRQAFSPVGALTRSLAPDG